MLFNIYWGLKLNAPESNVALCCVTLPQGADKINEGNCILCCCQQFPNNLAAANLSSPNKFSRKVSQWQTWHLIKAHSSLLNECVYSILSFIGKDHVNHHKVERISYCFYCQFPSWVLTFVRALVWLGPHGLVSECLEVSQRQNGLFYSPSHSCTGHTWLAV